MTIAEAEKYFKQYNGHGFHMCREEPSKYDEYKLLNISSEVEESWRQDLVDKIFEEFYACPERVWSKHSSMISLLLATKTKHKENGLRLLSFMEQMNELDKKQKILVIENMAGRTKPQKDGGCYLICSRTTLGKEMNDIMEKLMDFECGIDDNTEEHGWNNMKERHLCAISSYRMAFYRFQDVNRSNRTYVFGRIKKLFSGILKKKEHKILDTITGMRVKLISCDYAPADMPEQLPISCEVIRRIPGEDRPDYYIARCEQDIRYNRYTIRYLIIAPRFFGQELKQNLDEIALGVAYVGDESLLKDDKLDFNKCTYVAICMGTTRETKYVLRFWFEHGGTCIWAKNEAAKQKYGYAITNSSLPISKNLIEQLNALEDEYHSYLDWEEPRNPSPWSQKQKEDFIKRANDVLEQLRLDLGRDYEVINDVKSSVK